MELEGHVVEFIDSGALRLGYVREEQLKKIHVIDQRGRQASVPRSRVVIVHEAAAEEDFNAVARGILKRIEACSTEIDVTLLWDSVRAQGPEFSPKELATTYFGTTSPEAESAIFRELDREALHFRRKGNLFEPRSEDELAARRLRLARQRENDRFRERVAHVLRTAIQGERVDAAPEWPEILDRLERWLRHKNPDEVGRILETITGNARAREVAYDLLVRAGRVKASEDRFLLVRGMPIAFPSDVVQAASRLAPFSNGRRRMDRRGVTTVAIDDTETLEVDDAVTAFEESCYTVAGVHIADVAAFVAKDDILDREAYRRSATIYLPNVTVTMFPPRLSTDLASLVERQPRPAFSIEARFDSNGSLVDFQVFRSLIEVTDRMAYEEADRALERGHPTLSRLYGIAERLREARLSQGAQTHRRPEIRVRVKGGGVSVRRIDVETPARLIVSEMMILANRLAADHAAVRGIPIIFRTQQPPLEPPPNVDGLSEAIRFEMLRKSFKRSRLSLSPAPHAGLGLEAYTQMSSPIRRYADLVTQRQFAAALDGEPLPYGREELLDILTTAEAAEIEIRRLEHASTTFWVLTFLATEKRNHSLEAVVLDGKGSVELRDYLVRGKVSEPKAWQQGDVVNVAIDEIDPNRGTIRFRTCP